VTPTGQTRDPNKLRAQYLEYGWRYYLATIANYNLVCFEAVRSAILATAWLLVLQCYLRDVLGICAQIHAIQRQETAKILGIIKTGKSPSLQSKILLCYTLNHEEKLTKQRGAPKTAGP